jgi:hypothetical protein
LIIPEIKRHGRHRFGNDQFTDFINQCSALFIKGLCTNT